LIENNIGIRINKSKESGEKSLGGAKQVLLVKNQPSTFFCLGISHKKIATKTFNYSKQAKGYNVNFFSFSSSKLD
jgi:hypothetical protein